jgi:hypothetical protein
MGAAKGKAQGAAPTDHVVASWETESSAKAGLVFLLSKFSFLLCIILMTQKSARRYLIISTIVVGLIGAPGVLLALTSFFLFDAPGSEKNPATILLFFSALTLPLVCLLSIVLSWILYARQKFTVACFVAFVPIVNVVCGAGALIWLELFNGGRLS